MDLRKSGTDLKLYVIFSAIEALYNLILIQKPSYLSNFSHIWVDLTKFDAYLHKETGTFFLSQLGECPVSLQCTVSCFIDIKSVKYSTFYRKWIIDRIWHHCCQLHIMKLKQWIKSPSNRCLKSGKFSRVF